LHVFQFIWVFGGRKNDVSGIVCVLWFGYKDEPCDLCRPSSRLVCTVVTCIGLRWRRQGMHTEFWLEKFRRKPPLGSARKRLDGNLRWRRVRTKGVEWYEVGALSTLLVVLYNHSHNQGVVLFVGSLVSENIWFGGNKVTSRHCRLVNHFVGETFNSVVYVTRARGQIGWLWLKLLWKIPCSLW